MVWACLTQAGNGADKEKDVDGGNKNKSKEVQLI